MKLQTHWQRQFISVSQPMHSMVNSIRLQEDQNSGKRSSIPMFLIFPNAPCTNSFWSSSLAILAHSFPGSYSIFSSLSVTTAQLHHQIDREWKCRWAAGHPRGQCLPALVPVCVDPISSNYVFCLCPHFTHPRVVAFQANGFAVSNYVWASHWTLFQVSS